MAASNSCAVSPPFSKPDRDILRRLVRGKLAKGKRRVAGHLLNSLLPSVEKARRGLMSKRIIQKIGTPYCLYDPFLAAWLRRQAR